MILYRMFGGSEKDQEEHRNSIGGQVGRTNDEDMGGMEHLKKGYQEGFKAIVRTSILCL